MHRKTKPTTASMLRSNNSNDDVSQAKDEDLDVYDIETQEESCTQLNLVGHSLTCFGAMMVCAIKK